MLGYAWPEVGPDPAFDRLPEFRFSVPGVFSGNGELAPRQFFRRPEIVLILSHYDNVSANIARSLQRMYRPVFGKVW